MDKKVIFLIGPPGSGKGTQGKLLFSKTGFYRFITSKEGKEYIAQYPDDEQNQRQMKLYNEGKLFDPEWLVYRVQKERTRNILKRSDVGGIIYEGSPRTLYEAENFFKILSELVEKENIYVVVIEISDEEVKKRAGERFVCGKNEDHFITTRFSNLGDGDKCPKCDGVLTKRGLDKEAVDERINQYKIRTMPGIEFLKKHYDKVFTVDGSELPEDIHKNIIKVLRI